ncbi:two-component system, LytT family, response regulator [Flexibacter flexilis DSM 6793]|uniref:Two-component system, LytT family, response regulator n=1 Tax=Flexibacter flexilis DSM 6793 TaxID=927664 RepID=A0A1I1FGC7_9BACT|nr:LytTR family DNA-binding domain-containing protein [Flexibacter flexilis]SFB96748.1 two-component system, LytT family, response regulator [Flexibacter flexilis DSM 6793]
MQKIRALLVDDEESARDVLGNLLLRFCPQVELLAKCENLPEAVARIEELQPQLVFLDIEMPNYAGFEIVNFFPEINFKIIFVTAYDKYAIRAFEVAAMDYLLKPIDIERLKLSVERARKELDIEQQAQRLPLLGQTLESQQIKNIVISDRSQQYIIGVDEVIAIEAQESYCTIHTQAKNYVVSRNLKHFETMLASLPQFIRTHKSWLVNKKQLQSYSKSEMLITLRNGLVVKLSKYKKAEFEEAILK